MVGAAKTPQATAMAHTQSSSGNPAARPALRRAAKQAARKEQEFSQAIIQTAQAIVLVLDPQGRIVTFNPYMEEISGYSLAEVQGKDWFDTFLPRQVRARVREFFARAIDDIQTRGNVDAIVTKSGQLREIEWYDKTLKGAGGDTTGLLCIGQDITERRKAAEAIRDSEERYRTLFHDAVDGIALADADSGTIIDCNAALCRMVERDRSEIVGQPQSVLHSPQDLIDRQSPSFREHRAGNPGATLEDRLHTRSGKLVPVDVRGTRITMLSREYMLGIFRDITERKQAEEEARQFSRRLLDAREEDRRQMANVLHHEVGSAAVGLNARLLVAERALGRRDIAEARKTLAQAVPLLAEWVGRLRALAVQLRPPDLDLLGLPAALRALFADVTTRNSVQIRLRCQNIGKRIPVDIATALFRVVQESLTNAIRHASARAVHVELGIRDRAVRLSLKDDGVGFDVPGAFALGRSHVGLRAMREMVASHGGEFTIRSTIGKGTHIRVAIPLAAALAAQRTGRQRKGRERS
jgi:PAS domain S-box-containing protein